MIRKVIHIEDSVIRKVIHKHFNGVKIEKEKKGTLVFNVIHIEDSVIRKVIHKHFNRVKIFFSDPYFLFEILFF